MIHALIFRPYGMQTDIDISIHIYKTILDPFHSIIPTGTKWEFS